MDARSVLQRSRPFRHAPERAVDDLARTATTLDLGRGATLWEAGDHPASFTIIHRGLIKVVRPLPSGRDAIVGLFGPLESVGDVAVVQGIPYPASAHVCGETARIVRIPRDEVLAHMHRHPGLAISINQSMADRVHALHAKVEILSAGGVEARLASLLLDLARRFGDDLEDDTILIPVALPRQDLADLVSTTFETTVRVMSRWHKRGVVETTNDGFVVRNRTHLETTASHVLGKA